MILIKVDSYLLQVSSVVPKIPKMNVDDLLMLEAPKPPPGPKPEATQATSFLEPQRPLPPIGKETKKEKQTLNTEEVQGEIDETTDGDAFFLTQVCLSVCPCISVSLSLCISLAFSPSVCLSPFLCLSLSSIF